MSKRKQFIVQESQANYEKAEMDSLRNALKRSYKERFEIMMELMKMNIMFRNAKITRSSFQKDK